MAIANNTKILAKHLIKVLNFIIISLLRILSVGPLPKHVAFIMDGNRRYAKKNKLEPKNYYRPGLLSAMSIIKQCYDLGIRYITMYSFSIDNFKRRPEEVNMLMNILQEKIESILEDDSFIIKYGIRLHFVGNLALLSNEIQAVVNRAMVKTSENRTTFVIICLAYSSTDETTRAIEETVSFNCQEKIEYIRYQDIEKRMYVSIAPKPDIVIRSGGGMGLSKFLLWQTESCLLYSPRAFWPEIGLWHLAWAVIIFQRHFSYLQKIRHWS